MLRLSEIPRAVLDSDVIVSRALHELMGRVGSDARLINLVWSEELLAEAKRVLIENKPVPEHVADRWVGYMRENFPDGCVDIKLVDPSIDLSAMTKDPDDEHVCALALAGAASYLFTFDRGYLRAALASEKVRVVSPDVFLSEMIEQEPEALMRVIEKQAAAWGGGKEIPELLDAYERARAPVFAGKARSLFDVTDIQEDN